VEPIRFQAIFKSCPASKEKEVSTTIGRGAPASGKTDSGLRGSHAVRWWVLAVLGLAQLMIMLDATVVNIALPHAQRDLGFSDGSRQWVITGYALAFGSLLLLGGMLTEWASWRWVMYINVALAAPALIGAALLLAKPAITMKPKLDIPGVVVVSAGLFAIVYGFAHVESTSWTDPVALGSMFIGAVLLAVFVGLESKVAHPLLPLRVVLDRTRGGSFLAVFVLGMGMFSIFLFLTYYFAASLGYSPIKTGLAYLPMVVAVGISSTTMSSLVLPKVGPKIVVSAGFLVAAAGMALLTRLELDSSYATHILPGLILLGLGIGGVMTTSFQGATSGLHHDDAGVASALINTGQQIGGSISTALLTTIASSATTDYLTSHKLSALTAAQAGVEGYTTTLAWGSGFFVVGAVIAAFLIPNRALEPSEGEPVIAH
jgi:MFS family permease